MRLRRWSLLPLGRVSRGESLLLLAEAVGSVLRALCVRKRRATGPDAPNRSANTHFLGRVSRYARHFHVARATRCRLPCERCVDS
jgi:hypothetical protein